MGVDAVLEFETFQPLDSAALSDLRHRIGDAFGDTLLICRESRAKTGPISQHAIEPCGENRYEVNLFCRFYDIGYERGPWPELAGVIEWLRRQLIVSRIFYGGDCDDVLKEVTPDTIEATWAHFARNGTLPYLGIVPGRGCPDCGGGVWCSGSSRGREM